MHLTFKDRYNDPLSVNRYSDNPFFYLNGTEDDQCVELSFDLTDAPNIAAAILEAGGFADQAAVVRSIAGKPCATVTPEAGHLAAGEPVSRADIDSLHDRIVIQENAHMNLADRVEQAETFLESLRCER